jgi:parallel beta-helix repeat protein
MLRYRARLAVVFFSTKYQEEDPMRCAECGTQQPPGSVFCGTCGAPLPADALAAARPISSGLSGQLLVESGPDRGREFQVQGTMRIGRTAENEIALDDSQISRHHAAISREADGFSLEDLGSTNGTFLNEQRIVERHHLKDGDRIRVGNTTLAFHWMPTPTPMPVPPDDAGQPTITASWDSAPATLPPWLQAEEEKRPSRLSAGKVVLGAFLALVICVIVAAGISVLLGRSVLDLPLLNTRRTTPVAITRVVTSAPPGVMTVVATSTLEPPDPVTVRVAPDGSGDYASLEEAVEAVPPASTINLDPGNYQLSSALEIDKSLSLRGAGMDETIVAGTVGDQMVLFVGPGSFVAEGITFRYEGTGWARVMTVDGGGIDITRCRFTGGVRSEEEGRGGDGLLLWAHTTGSVRESRFEGNQSNGIEMHDRSELFLEDSVVADNGGSGLIYWDESGGAARRNECTGNGLHGIEVREGAQPLLEGNVCTGNAEDGIAYFEEAGGVARENTCSANGLHGIGVNEAAQPALEGNVCQDNERVGIRYSGTAGGAAYENRCIGNGSSGISITDEAQPVLEGNVSSLNAQSGVVYFDQAAGAARGNTSTENGLHGISVNDEARPELEGNTCTLNVESGIVYFEQASGVARGNTSTGNGLHGIGVNEEARPILEGNICTENEEVGIRFSDTAAGEARQNECAGNGLHGITVVDMAQPLLEGNECHGNVESGIVYFDRAGGTARQNRCSENGLHGIGVNEEAQPTLEGNICQNNSQVGVRFSGSSGGLARDNTSSGNGIHGFQVKDQAAPTLEGNTSNDNVEGGFVFMDSAGGVARENVCLGNQWGIYVADTAHPELVDGGCDDSP